jgi:geranylgeranyl reductase family protein
VTQERHADVIIVGGGPAGSVLAWDLARRGVQVLLLERARFPREKVCGDYVEPRGLRILQAMGCLEHLEPSKLLPIARTATFVEWECRYSGPIPSYGLREGLPAHGYLIPRERLDAAMLDTAMRAGAIVHEETAVTGVSAGPAGVEVTAGRGPGTTRYRAQLVVGADGVNSVVAKSQGLSVADPRRTVVAQRAYAVAEGEIGENGVFFDESLFPGYGWIFPMAGGRVNVGVGLLSETRRRRGANIPELFASFVEGLRRHHPRCAAFNLCSQPIGGVVRTYGAAGRNHFDGGLLIGDAGSFVDPVTGEGITPGMESALLAAPTLLSALETGQFDAGGLAPYEAAFRAYFDPSMIFLDYCAAILRNRHLARPSLKALARGCDLAQADAGFARMSGSFFGGQDIQPVGILGQMWARIIQDVLLAWPRFLSGVTRSSRRPSGTSPGDLIEWQAALSRSALSDPLWHARWMIDVQRQLAGLLATAARTRRDPRAVGLLQSSLSPAWA